MSARDLLPRSTELFFCSFEWLEVPVSGQDRRLQHTAPGRTYLAVLGAGSTDVSEQATGPLDVNYTSHDILYFPIGDAMTMAGVPRSL